MPPITMIRPKRCRGKVKNCQKLSRPRLSPSLAGALTADTWPACGRYLASAYETIAELHNAVGITPLLDARSDRRCPSRPYFGIYRRAICQRPGRADSGCAVIGALFRMICRDGTRSAPNAVPHGHAGYVDHRVIPADGAIQRG